MINKVNENVYDTFINRVVIPIENLKGEVVGFTGRIFNGEDNTAKYLNTKETEIFKKVVCYLIIIMLKIIFVIEKVLLLLKAIWML